MNLTTLGIDLTKISFSRVGMNKHGNVVFRKTLTRTQIPSFIAQYPSCLIGMEVYPVIKHFYQKLVEQGKYKKGAIVGCMRKFITILNSMVRDKNAWCHA